MDHSKKTKKPTLLHSHSIQLLKVCLLLFPPVTVSMQRRPRGENKNPAKHHSSSSFCEMLQLTLFSRAAEAGLGSDKMELSPQTTFLLFQKQCFNTAVKTLAVKHGSASTSVSAGI